MNVLEKILARASGRDSVRPGEIVEAEIDTAMINDITGPLAVKAFKEMGVTEVWDPRRIIAILDHQVPADSIESANLHRIMRDFAHGQGLTNFYDVGDGGVCHQVMIEKGHVLPGDLVVGADSHTCTYGAVGAFATGIGSTEMAAVFATGKLWFRVPAAYMVEVNGGLKDCVAPKDVILHILGVIKADGAIYKGIEFGGSTVSEMSVSGRMTLCNMAVEMGAKTGIVKADEKVKEYLRGRTKRGFEFLEEDGDASYEKRFSIDAEDLEPQIAMPYSVDNVKAVSEVDEVPIDQAFLGSCTNGRLEDLRIAARIVEDRKIARNVRFIVQPASSEVYLDALREGLLDIFVKAGAFVGGPSCGPCFGGHTGILGPDEVCISTSNRNFRGRMGSPSGKIYLASPATVAASVVTGVITDPRELEE